MEQQRLPFGLHFFSKFFSPTFDANMAPASTCLQTHDAMLNALPSFYSNVNAVWVNDNLAVIPGEWTSGNMTSAFYDIVPTEPCVASTLEQVKAADFIAFDESFFDIIGPDAKLEQIQDFPPDLKHVHEAPVYLPDTNELLYSDTSIAGSMFAINIDTHKVRTITLDPPLANINGGTIHRGTVYLATNGSPVRGIYSVNLTSGTSDAIVNNYRGRHLNSPNDLVFDSNSVMWFTDPTYGWDQSWPGVQPPELPMAIYRFDPRTKQLQAVSASVVTKPNGLALSVDEKTLYVADSNSSSKSVSSHRAVWAFDVTESGLLENPKLVYQVEGGWPDGLRVTQSGLLLSAVYGGVDIVNPACGLVLGKINTPDDIIYNLEPGRGKGVWLLTGTDHVYKATIREQPAPMRT